MSMKALNFAEVQLIANELKKFVGARFQNIFTTEKTIAFELYFDNQTTWWMFSMDAMRPLIIKSEPSGKSKTTPLGLFFKAHVAGKRLRDVLYDPRTARVIKLNLGTPEEEVGLEARLFPHGQNLILSAGGKKISWEKIKDLKGDDPDYVPDSTRSWDEITAEFLQIKTPKRDEFSIENEILKREAAISKIKENLSENLWKKTGEWLKLNQTLDVPVVFVPYTNSKLKLSRNIEICFEKAKQFDKKQAGSLERLNTLEKEIESLRTGTFKFAAKKVATAGKTHRGLKIDLLSAVAYMGKSAKDNIDLLRQSKPWHYWVHLTDYPGAHGFIQRNKNQNIPLEDIKKVASKLAERSKIGVGEIFDVAVAECRFVKPIRGDKLGRVTFSNETRHTFKR